MLLPLFMSLELTRHIQTGLYMKANKGWMLCTFVQRSFRLVTFTSIVGCAEMSESLHVQCRQSCPMNVLQAKCNCSPSCDDILHLKCWWSDIKAYVTESPGAHCSQHICEITPLLLHSITCFPPPPIYHLTSPSLPHSREAIAQVGPAVFPPQRAELLSEGCVPGPRAGRSHPFLTAGWARWPSCVRWERQECRSARNVRDAVSARSHWDLVFTADNFNYFNLRAHIVPWSVSHDPNSW